MKHIEKCNCHVVQKNLLKLYLNDVGMLTKELYGNNLKSILNDEKSVNLGAVYESVVELKAYGHKLFYYDNRQKGEADSRQPLPGNGKN
ncbi:MAG: DUF4143 domain-containing protein [Bacteroides sp.]|nr:DUF4143 domain-containing protein [Bacteroides sp.]